MDTIKALGIEAVLNLCAECYDLHEIEATAGLDVHWLPIADEDAPELDAAHRALSWLDTKVAQNNKTLVHCRFGIGRTGTMVTAWLLKQGYVMDDAQEMLSHTPAVPMSRRQWDFLNAYSQSIGKPAVQQPINLENRRSRLGRFFRKYIQMQDWDNR